MTNTEATITGSELFYQYLNKHKAEVKDQSLEGYYHANVVADAYKKGFSDGKKSGKKDIISAIIRKEVERFTQQSNQIYILSKRIISYLCESDFSVSALYINLDFKRPRVIISVPENLLLNDEFVKKAYTKMAEIRDIYLSLFKEYLDIGLVSSDNLEGNLLAEDGFGYQEKFNE